MSDFYFMLIGNTIKIKSPFPKILVSFVKPTQLDM